MKSRKTIHWRDRITARGSFLRTLVSLNGRYYPLRRPPGPLEGLASESRRKNMKRKQLSIRRSMAVEHTQKVFERLYGDRPSKELEALAERVSQQPRWDADRVAVLGYN